MYFITEDKTSVIYLEAHRFMKNTDIKDDFTNQKMLQICLSQVLYSWCFVFLSGKKQKKVSCDLHVPKVTSSKEKYFLICQYEPRTCWKTGQKFSNPQQRLWKNSFTELRHKIKFKQKFFFHFFSFTLFHRCSKETATTIAK